MLRATCAYLLTPPLVKSCARPCFYKYFKLRVLSKKNFTRKIIIFVTFFTKSISASFTYLLLLLLDPRMFLLTVTLRIKCKLFCYGPWVSHCISIILYTYITHPSAFFLFVLFLFTCCETVCYTHFYFLSVITYYYFIL